LRAWQLEACVHLFAVKPVLLVEWQLALRKVLSVKDWAKLAKS
jgi:hypothetical protein